MVQQWASFRNNEFFSLVVGPKESSLWNDKWSKSFTESTPPPFLYHPIHNQVIIIIDYDRKRIVIAAMMVISIIIFQSHLTSKKEQVLLLLQYTAFLLATWDRSPLTDYCFSSVLLHFKHTHNRQNQR